MASAKMALLIGTLVKENGVKLEESLNVFRSDKFDSQSYVQSRCSLNQKDIRQLCSYLLDLKRASAEEMLIRVYANFLAFIRTFKEISDLERESYSLRNSSNYKDGEIRSDLWILVMGRTQMCMLPSGCDFGVAVV
ncbi:hypothetical protein ACFX14_045687 [Malus domestica]